MLDGWVGQPAERIELYRRHGVYRDRTLADIVVDGAARWGERTAVIYREERITYAELRERVDSLARGLIALGCRPHDRVVVQLPNLPEFIYTYFACLRVGAISVLSLPVHREAEVRFFLEHTAARFYVIPDRWRTYDHQAMAARLRGEVPSLQQVLVAGTHVQPGNLSLTEVMNAGRGVPADLDAQRPDPDDCALMLLSSGTTGQPKLIPRTHNDYDYLSRTLAELFQFDTGTVSLAVAPAAHAWTLGNPGIQGTLLAGGTVVISPGTEAETVFQQIEQHRVTFTNAVPALLIPWANDPALDRYDLSSLKIVLTGGQKCNPEPAAWIQQRLGVELHNMLGMGEGLVVTTRPGDDEYTRFHTVGRPVSPFDEVRVVDDDGNPVSPGEMGELWTRGPYTICGYYRAPQISAAAFTADGWYRTGDMVSVDTGGRVRVHGRKKDLINRGGEKISAEEVENLLQSHPKIAAVAVVAVPDPVMGERACACVVLRPGQRLDLDEVAAFLLERGIAKYKLPERLKIFDALPLTSVGKVAKNVLRATISEGVGAQGA